MKSIILALLLISCSRVYIPYSVQLRAQIDNINRGGGVSPMLPYPKQLKVQKATGRIGNTDYYVVSIINMHEFTAQREITPSQWKYYYIQIYHSGNLKYVKQITWEQARDGEFQEE